MLIKPLSPNFIKPEKSTELSAAFDIFMPNPGILYPSETKLIPLGFSTEIPPGLAALLLPRSSTGTKKRLSLTNTLGLIDSDYRGEWMASLISHNPDPVFWDTSDRLLQFILIPVPEASIVLSEELSDTLRGSGGFGSTG